MALRQFSRQISRPLSVTVTPLDILWRWLTQPLLLLLLAGLALALVLGGLVLPQVPANYDGDPTAISRWLLNEGASMGTAGDILRGLGLFDVLESPLLRWLLILLVALTVLHLGQQLGVALQMRRVQQMEADALRVPVEAGEPMMLPMEARHRLRTTHEIAPDAMLVAVRDELNRRFDRVDEVRVQEVSLTGDDRPEVAEEMRLLATRDLRVALLRPLLPLALLLALGAAWWAAGQSWAAISPPLVPGDSFAHSAQPFRVQYVVLEPNVQLEDPPADEVDSAVSSVPQLGLRVQMNDTSRELPLSRAETRLRLDGVGVRASVVAPGLLVRTQDGSDQLTTLGSSTFRNAVGLEFPSVNLESPALQAGEAVLEFVRVGSGDGATQFEVNITAQAEASRRVTIGDTVQTLDAGGVALEVVRVPSVQVAARRTPGAWLLLPAALLLAAGAVGFWHRSAFVLVQLVPWPNERTVVVAQGSSREVARLAPRG